MSARSTSSCCHCCIFSQAAIVTLKPRRRNFVLNMTGVIILLMDRWDMYYMGVSKNSGAPKSSILIRFSIIFTSILGYPCFWKHPYQPVQDFFHQEYYEPKQCTFFFREIRPNCHRCASILIPPKKIPSGKLT